MNRIPLLCTALACCAAPTVIALETEERVTITATRTPLALDDALAPVVVITGEELRRSATFDIAEALRTRAGLEIGRNGGPGQATSLFIRGTNSNHALVLVDGVRVNPGTLGGAALQNIRPHDIERIEVVKGPRSTLYGTEAVGGVVNIITRGADRPLRVDALAGTGAHGTREAGAGFAARRGSWGGGLRVDRLTTDGFPPQAGSTIARGHDNATVGAHLSRDAGTVAVTLRHRDARGTTEYLDFFGTPLAQDFTNSVTALAASGASGRIAWTLRVARAVDELRQLESPDHALTRRDSLDLQADWAPSTAHELNGGIHAAREHTRAEVFGSAFDERPDTHAVFAQYQFHGDDTRALLATRRSRHDAFGAHTTWNAEVGRDVSARWTLTAGAGTAFRAPDATERFGFAGDPALRPERSRNLEVGARARLGAARRFEFSAYENRIDDLVAFDAVANALANVARARIRGAEATFVHAGERWTWRQSLVFQQPLDLATHEPLPRRARRSAQTSVNYAAGRGFALGVDLLASGPRKDSGFSTVVNAGYVLVNLSAAWAFAPAWRLDARLENALDTGYETAAGFPQAGRSLFVRLHWHSG